MATRKAKRFSDGGETIDDNTVIPSRSRITQEDLDAANASDDAIATLNKRKGWTDTEDSVRAPKKAPIVTKAELEASGLSLRDYLNKQRGLTRRGTPAVTDTDSAPRPGRGGATADELAAYTAATKAAKPKYETAYDRMNRENREQGRGSGSIVETIKNRILDNFAGAGSDRLYRERTANKVNPGFKKGGKVKVSSASKRADGIAQRGKTRGRMI